MLHFSLQDVMNLQAQLAEATMLYQRQEEVLHQRERELTALKGALKEEVECHDREMEALREQFGQDMKNLRKTMEEFTQVIVRKRLFFLLAHKIQDVLSKIPKGAMQQVFNKVLDNNGYFRANRLHPSCRT